MVTEHDSEFEPWPAEIDSVALAICPLLTFVIESTAADSPERKVAMDEVLALATRIRAALRPKPRLN
jgi:hypothetical protein